MSCARFEAIINLMIGSISCIYYDETLHGKLLRLKIGSNYRSKYKQKSKNSLNRIIVSYQEFKFIV